MSKELDAEAILRRIFRVATLLASVAPSNQKEKIQQQCATEGMTEPNVIESKNTN